MSGCLSINKCSNSIINVKKSLSQLNCFLGMTIFFLNAESDSLED